MRLFDFHIHPWTKDFMLRNEPIVYACNFFKIKIDELPQTVEQIIEELEQNNVQGGVILGQDTSSTKNKHFKNYTLQNEYLLDVSEKSGKKLVPFAGVDPNSENAHSRLRELLKNGFRGLKIHSSANSVYPNDKKMCRIYEVCQEYDAPILFHTGTTGLGYCKISYSKPEYIDDVCQDFPDLKVIMAHFGWPWSDVAISIALRNKNAYIDISGWLPRYIPSNVINYMNGPLKDKFLFGTDYPMIRYSRWINDFESSLKNKLKDEVREKILWENAERLVKG